jgi:hypothetical protein
LRLRDVPASQRHVVVFAALVNRTARRVVPIG